MRKKSVVMGWLLLVSLFASPMLLLAQGTTGARLETVIIDESDAVVPGVTVTVTNVETGAQRSLISNNEGRCVFANLAPAQYDLEAMLPGFKTTRRQGISLNVGAEVVVNVALSVGEVSEEITVVGGAPLVETRSAAISGVVEENVIREVPLNGRSFTNLIQLKPGVALTRAGRQHTLSGTGSKMALGGTRPHQMSFQLDGADMMGKDNSNPAGASGVLMGVDTIREFRVSTSTFSAEYGRNSGGVVNAVTKSGSNEFHGTVFAFHRNDNLDARNFFDPGKAPEFKRNQFGFVAGGPIVENKTFFFGGYEGLRERLGVTNSGSVPNLDARSGVLPDKTVAVEESIKPYLALYPEPNGPDLGGGVARYFWAGSNDTDQDNFLIRLDHQLSDNDSLSGRVFFDDGSTKAPTSLGLMSTLTDSRIQSYLISHQKVFGPRVINDFRFAFNRSNLTIDDAIPSNLNSLEFIDGRGFGRLEPGGIDDIASGATTPRFWTQNMFEYIDNVVFTQGQHTLKFGGILKRIQFNGFSAARFRGEYEFNTLEDFLLANVRKFESSNVTSSTRGLRQWLFGFYLQDDLRVSSRLTLNLGLRYEAITSPNEVAGRISNLQNRLDSQVTLGNPYFKNPSLKNFAPRIGLAFDPTGDGKTAIRAGFGIFFDQLTTIYYRDNFMRLLPFQQRFNVRPGSNVPDLPFPDAAVLFPQEEVLSDPRVQVDLANYDPSQPYTMQYNLTVQRELLPDVALMVGYMGSLSRHNARNVNWNSALPTEIIGGEKFFAPGSPRRNPNFSAVLQREMDSNSNYNSLQVQVGKRYSHGVSLDLVYQWARTMDEISGISGSTDFSTITSFSMDPDDRSRDYGRAAFDIRQLLTLNATFEIPYGDLQGAAGQLLGGWKLSGLLNYSSGEAFTVVNRVDFSGANVRIFGAQERPDVVSGASNDPKIGDPNQWFDASAFSVSEMAATSDQLGRFGNLGRNTLQGPNLFTLDLGILKSFTIGEDNRIEFRGEFFNITNRPNFDTPNFQAFLSTTRRNPNAGRITATRTSSRQVQLALKYVF